MQSLEEEGFTLDLEPRKVFINILNRNILRIEFTMYFERQYSASIKPMMGLIDILDKESYEKLAPQRKRLQAFCDNVNLASYEEMESIFHSILQYLHSTYLREFKLARPKYASSTLEVPKP